MWPSSRSTEKPANTVCDVNFNVQNPTADSIGWSPQVDNLTFSAATERSVVISDNAITEDRP